MKNNREYKKNSNEGSILILTMLALAGAVSIAVAMSSISIVERKMTTKSRKSTIAFQSASSGLEWAMKKINDAEGIPGSSKTIQEVFGVNPDNKGQIICPSNLFSNNSRLSCKITFLKRDPATGKRVLITGSANMEDIIAVRSTGIFGLNTEKVGRALEAYAMPNCGTDERVADFCIDSSDSSGVTSWGEAVANCEGAGKRLCTAAELVAANQLSSVIISHLFSADVTGNGEYAVVDDGSIDNLITDSGITATSNYRCCRNR